MSGPPSVTARYSKGEELSRSASAVVIRAEDRQLGRMVTLRTLPEDVAADEAAQQRFFDAAHGLARLQHPAIPPVHDVGRLPDGTPYLAMTETEGHTLQEAIEGLHLGQEGVSLHGLVEAIRTVARALAHAHDRGVIHGDLEPDSVVLGPDGQVLVIDWGSATDPMGSPAYRAPEQAWVAPVAVDSEEGGGPDPSEAPPVGPHTDVYGMGVLIYALLTGRDPFEGSPATVLDMVRAGPPADPVTHPGALAQPAELVEVCRRAISRDGVARGTARHIADELQAWLEGRLRRDQAERRVAAARQRLPRLAALRAWGRGRADLAVQALEGLPPTAPVRDKAPLWALEDEGAALTQRALALEVEVEQLLGAALRDDGACTEAHALLAGIWRGRHVIAEAHGQEGDRLRAEGYLRAHAEALPPLHAERADHLQYLEGYGSLSVTSDPDGAQVWLERHQVQGRRLVPEPVRMIGRTPLHDTPLPMGSYRLRLVARGHDPVLVAVRVGRNEHADGVPPGRTIPRPIRLPVEGRQFPDEVVIPAGWFLAGGDPQALNGLPRQRVWLDAFVIQRFGVTQAAFLAFVESVRLTRGLTAALAYAPRDPGPTGDNRRVFYDQGPNGQLLLGATPDGDEVDPNWPITFVTWHAASAYAAWYASKTGQAWRLPLELEWAKAARGADGRLYPWGDFHDPTWAAGLLGRDPVLPEPVDSYPIDESPYGVRGLAGNAQDWCLEPFTERGIASADGSLPDPLPIATTADAFHPVRGGGFALDARWARCASRGRIRANARARALGFRLVRPLDGPSG